MSDSEHGPPAQLSQPFLNGVSRHLTKLYPLGWLSSPARAIGWQPIQGFEGHALHTQNPLTSIHLGTHIFAPLSTNRADLHADRTPRPALRPKKTEPTNLESRSCPLVGYVSISKVTLSSLARRAEHEMGDARKWVLASLKPVKRIDCLSNMLKLQQL